MLSQLIICLHCVTGGPLFCIPRMPGVSLPLARPQVSLWKSPPLLFTLAPLLFTAPFIYTCSGLWARSQRSVHVDSEDSAGPLSSPSRKSSYKDILNRSSVRPPPPQITGTWAGKAESADSASVRPEVSPRRDSRGACRVHPAFAG